MKKTSASFFFLIFFCFLYLSPKSKAMDPATIGILAPMLMPYAASATQYSLDGATRTVPGFVGIGKGVLDIFRIPLGVGQVVLGSPFGFLGHGVENIAQGMIAPFGVAGEVFLLPVRFLGF